VHCAFPRLVHYLYIWSAQGWETLGNYHVYCCGIQYQAQLITDLCGDTSGERVCVILPEGIQYQVHAHFNSHILRTKLLGENAGQFLIGRL